MPTVQLLAVCLPFLMSAAVSEGAAQSAPPGVIVTKSAAPMLAVARLLTEETWNPILDRRIQGAPAAAELGAAWAPSDPRWQKARAALGARMTRILDSYARSGQVTGHIETQLGRVSDGASLDATVAALAGPAGAALVRQQAKTAFIVTAGTARPNGPAIGSPEWNAQLRDLAKRFDERIGSSVPPDDATQTPQVEKLATSPVWETLRRLWDFVIANATRQLTTAMNLMLFDDQAAIERDIANAVAGR